MKYLKFPKLPVQDIFILLGLVSVWRGLLFVLAFIADRLLPYQPSFPYAFTLLPQLQVSRMVYSFANFDGVHYLTLAREGYFTTNFTQAFFPVFPYLLRIPSQWAPSVFNPLVLGLVLSTGAFVGSVFLLFFWVQAKFGKALAYRSVLALLLFPSTIFFASLYTESLFLFLVLGSFVAASKSKWGLASFFALIAGATRIVGIFLVPALLIELWVQQEYGKPSISKLQQFVQHEKRNLLMILLSSAGLLIYMGFLHHFFNDAFYFLHVQSEFGAGRSEQIVLYPQVAYRSLKILLTAPFDLKYIAYAQEFIAGTLSLVALFLVRRRVSLGILFFSFCCFFLPTLSGTFSSMLRYILVCPPIFIAMALAFKKLQRFELVGWILLGLLAILNAVLFLQGYWVA
ncbi:hypothetical protein KBD71_02980 [Candidatus Woesebacteria bacterium]|nr:hypothetical protein [Candidatus Woesebacteria bacterium]